MDRARQHLRERLSEALREELTSIVEGELSDPRLAPLALSEIHLSADGKSLRALVSAKNYIRRELGLRLGLRKVPELVFELDKSQQYGARIDELLKRAG